MKVEVIRTKKFEPVMLQIVIESEDELRELWHRLNVAASSIGNNSVLELPRSWGNTRDLWRIVDGLLSR